MDDALGMVEIKGLASAIAVADVMVKTANIRLIGAERARGHGWTTIKVMGDVAAVTAAVSAGKQKGEECNGFVSSKVIPRPVQGVKEMFCVPPNEKKDEPEKGKDGLKKIETKPSNSTGGSGAKKTRTSSKSTKRTASKPVTKQAEKTENVKELPKAEVTKETPKAEAAKETSPKAEAAKEAPPKAEAAKGISKEEHKE